jgi:FdhD protein
LRIDAALIASLPDRMRGAQTVFDDTGGLHAAALFDERGELLCVREDVGRHNAVDKAIGWALLNGRLPMDGVLLQVSGRASFEIVQKALVARIPFVGSVSAASSLAIDLAAENKMTLVGFIRDGRFVVYAGAERIVQAQQASSEEN